MSIECMTDNGASFTSGDDGCGYGTIWVCDPDDSGECEPTEEYDESGWDSEEDEDEEDD